MAQSNDTPETTPSEAPFHIVAEDGTIYERAHDQEKTRLYLACRDAEAALLALVAPEKADEAKRRLITLSDAFSDYHHYRIEEREQRLLEWLPQHAAVIKAAFWPDDAILSVQEYMRHRRCVVPLTGKHDSDS